MSSVLIDKYGRQLNYLRLSVTDRCNFRCNYCMPEHGVKFANRNDLLSFDELLHLSEIFCTLGVTKIRVTGGEPFVRTGIMPFLQKLQHIEGLRKINITTNGTLIADKIVQLKELGITNINISFDSLDSNRFYTITRRNDFEKVFLTLLKLLEEGFKLKLNAVVSDMNADDIVPLIELTQKHNLSVRFLEEMPFNGSNSLVVHQWSYKRIYQRILQHYGQVCKLIDEPHSTSLNYKIEGFIGSFGIIPSFSRTFCGTCNRIRLSATGELRTCLYGAPAANLRDLIRNGASEDYIAHQIISAVQQRANNGHEAEALSKEKHSMSVLGG